MRYTWLDNLRLISEFVYFNDAPDLLGVSKRTLTAWVKGKKNPGKEHQKEISRIAGKMRRSVAQRVASEKKKAERELRQRTRAEMLQKGITTPLPIKLPELFSIMQHSQQGSPAYTYDVRGFTDDELVSLLQFMKRMIPQGAWSWTYEVKPGGTTQHGGVLPDNPDDKIFNQHQVLISHTMYEFFCVKNEPYAGQCQVLTEGDLRRNVREINNRSKKRRVTAVTFSWPKPQQFSEEEMAEDIARGADPLTGWQYIFLD